MTNWSTKTTNDVINVSLRLLKWRMKLRIKGFYVFYIICYEILAKKLIALDKKKAIQDIAMRP